MSRLDRLLFPETTRLGPLLARFMVPTSVLSALYKNTLIVAMCTPRLQEWADANDVPASKLMIPLSYAAITGGMMTLVHTSADLIVTGLMEAEGYEPPNLVDVTWIGVPVALVVIAYFVLGAHRFLSYWRTSAPRWSSGSREEFYLVAPCDREARRAAPEDEKDEDDADRSGTTPRTPPLQRQIDSSSERPS